VALRPTPSLLSCLPNLFLSPSCYDGKGLGLGYILLIAVFSRLSTLLI
jgi:hypothetical protein